MKRKSAKLFNLINDLITTILHSTNIITVKKRLSKQERSNLKLNSELDEAIVGLLLGDGHIDGRGSKDCSNANARFHFATNNI